ncbi:MAG TPA: universal stress protein [Smithellaceae bacterium]|nr:universal stress protein [Smithellaceae bacterium]
MKLVLGYNGSDSSKKALALVQKYAKEFNAEVHILTSLISEQVEQRVRAPISLATTNDLKQLRKNYGEESDIAKEAESQLESAQKILANEGISCETHLFIQGLEPGEDIVDFAKKIGADFIVVGIGRTSRVGKMFFGSNAQYVILEASCPVITVK